MKNTILHNGKRYSCRIYDNGGKSIDRYTACFRAYRIKDKGLFYQYIAFNGDPFHPQGFGQHGESDTRIGGKHLGKRIEFSSLPKNAQIFVVNQFE